MVNHPTQIEEPSHADAPNRAGKPASSQSQRRASGGPIILRHSFRIFFLCAGVWAAMAVPIWLIAYTGFLELPGGAEPLAWHRHEMLFGFCAAAIAGFILTAIPNWTGQLPVTGWRLGVLASSWGAGRVAMASSEILGPGLTAALDMAFLVLLVITIGRELVAGGNWRNMPVLALIAVFATGNGLVHIENLGGAETADAGVRLSIFTLALLVSLIGGRIIPSFTRNWLSRTGATRLPAQFGSFDKVALAAMVAVLISQVTFPDAQATAVITLIAAALQAARLARWCGLATLSEPLLWVMHVGYGWLVIGLVLLGLSGLDTGVPVNAALHAITSGGFATIILAVMTRASLGHSGRELVATPATTAVYVLVTLAALGRVVAPFMGEDTLVAVSISGGLWTAAFALFVIAYWPVLTRLAPERP